MLYNLHYYPLFKKDTFYPRNPLPGKGGITNVELRGEGAIEASPISPSIHTISPSSGQTEIEEETFKPPMDTLWEFVNEKQEMTAYKPTRNRILSSEISSKARPILISTKDSKSQEVPAYTISNKYTGGAGNSVDLKSEQQSSSGHSAIVTLPNSGTALKKSGTKFWHGAAIGALAVGLAAFGVFVTDFIFGRRGRKSAKEARERQINTPDDDISVKAKW
jgi:hypothetical protein